MIVDLHSHTIASDGALQPFDLLSRARDAAVELFAITDHDTIDGYLNVVERVHELPGIRLIAGVEMSCVWGKHGIHVVGLNIDPHCPVLLDALQVLSQARLKRAHLIAEKLAGFGFQGALEAATEYAGGGQIGRPHFARFLLEQGHVQTMNAAFKRYLGAGKPCDIKVMWPSMQQVVQWLVDNGAVAVLAHPLRYKMTATKLRALLSDFKAAGGQAMEVISGTQQVQQTEYLAALAERYQMLASVGSDFHHPDFSWSEVGKIAKLPAHCQPVWSAWQ